MPIPINSIITDPQIQLSTRFVDSATVRQYVAALASGAEFPPIVIYEAGGCHYLADGFHRVAAYRFCGMAEVEAEIRQGTKRDAMVHAATANATNGKPMSQKEKQQAGKRLLKLTDWSDHEIARQLAVTRPTVGNWRKSLSSKNLPDSPRTVTRAGTTYQMDTGKIGKEQEPREQEKAATTPMFEEQGLEPTPEPVAVEWPASISLHCGDFAEVAKILQPDSFDLIITDPPYPREYLYLYDLLAQQAKALLKPGGSLLTMAGQSYLPEVMGSLAAELTYHWIISYDTPGGQAPQIWDRKVNAFWKPVLWYVKGEYKGKWHGDKIASDVNANDKRFHGWGQSESGIGKLVSEFASYGTGKVLDPFVGGGTTAIVCYRLRIPFVGIDLAPVAIETTKARLLEEINNGA